MSYQIPQQLEYKEKIMFGLTFKQLSYGFVFGILALLFFKNIPNDYLKYTLMSLSSSLGVCFMFLNLDTLIKNYWIYLKYQKLLKGEYKLKKFLGVKDIGENFILLSGDKKVSVLKIQPINFSIKPKNEREAIMFSFQRFLNSLDFPTQIIMKTESIKLDSYLNSLKSKIEDETFLNIFESYKKHLENVISTKKIMNRVFYIIIPESGNIEIQTEICIERLHALNMKVDRLNSVELKKLLIEHFSGDGKGKDIRGAMSPEIIENHSDYLEIYRLKKEKKKKKAKKEKKSNFVKKFFSKQFFCPKIQKIKIFFKTNPIKLIKQMIEESKNNKKNKKSKEDKEEEKQKEKDKNKIDQKFYRTIYANGYPRNVEPGFLDKIVSSLADFDLSIHIKPYPIENMLVDLTRELQKQQADLYAMKMKGIFNPSLEIQYQDTRGTLENLQKGEERLFNVSLYINCRADSRKELNLLTKKIESELNSLMILPRIARLRMLQGFKSTAPIGIDELNANRNITTDALSAFFPFTSKFLQVDNGGIWLGLNKNNIPIIKDIFKLPNPNGLVLAQSGGGKSYFCKLLITRYLLNGTKVMVIDPQGEYKGLVKRFEGQRINLSRDSDTMINPLDLMGHDYAEKRLALMDLMQIMLGKLTDPQKSIIDKAISQTYKNKGINKDASTWNNTPPILEDLLKVLKQMEKKAVQIEKPTLQSLTNRLEMYVDGVFSFMNKHTNIDFNNKFVCFDIGNLPKQVKPAIMFLVLDYVYMKMRSDLDRKLLLIDESWSLLSRTEDAGYIFEIVKTCRKFNMGLLLINQEVEGLLTTQAGKSILANSAYTMLMRQKPAVIDNICKTFNLSQSEKQHLLTAAVGEGLLIMEDDHSKIKVIASPEEHKLITTNADELNEDKEESKPTIVKNGRNITINVDSSLGFFKYNNVSKDEKDYLLKLGYKISSNRSIISNKKEKYLLRPRSNEGIPHFFLVQDIKRFLEKNKIPVQIYQTVKPDLVFEVNKKKYAIEVETGKVMHDRKRLEKKVKLLKEEYGDNWFFAVTDKNFAPSYKKLGETFDLRCLKHKLSKMIKVHKNS
jgi:type IV secretory pathway VirB4 component